MMSNMRMVLLLSCFLFLPGLSARAQEVDALLQRYSDQQAVFAKNNERLVITYEKGKFAARSYISTERLLIGELSPGIFNREFIFHSYFNRLDEFDCSAMIYGPKGYSKQKEYSATTSRYEDASIFYDDMKKTEISFNGLTPRSLIKNDYTILHTDLHMLPSFFFEENIPVAQAVYEVTAPKYVDIKFVVKGIGADRVKQSRTENKKTITYTFTASDLPASKAFDGEPSTSWHSLQVVSYIASYQLPGKEVTMMLSDPAHLYSYLFDFIRHINVGNDSDVAKLAANIIKGDVSQRQKAMHIYQWVQANIHYVAFEDSLGGFIPRPAALVCNRKFGDCKDMTSTLVALCRQAGIEAYFTWIGTRTLPYSYLETPVTKVANHMICTIKLDGEWIFLDGTHSLIPFGCVPQSIQDKEALIGISEKEYKIIKVPVTDVSENAIVDTTELEIKGDELTGRATLYLKGYTSWDVQQSMQYRKNDARDNYARNLLIRGSNKYDQKSYTYTVSDTGDKSCRFSSVFTIPDHLKKVGNEYYLNMSMDRDKEYIDTAGRNVPFYFRFRSTDREVVILTIPDGYHASYLPPTIEGNVNGLWHYKVKYSQIGRKLVLEKEFKTLSLTIPPSDFVTYNMAMDELKKHYKESVVLKAD
jgi:hypothetical protein